MDRDHKSLVLALTATIDDLELDQYDTCPSLPRAFCSTRDRPPSLKENREQGAAP